jgi:hypothetical protein
MGRTLIISVNDDSYTDLITTSINPFAEWRMGRYYVAIMQFIKPSFQYRPNQQSHRLCQQG